MFIPMFFPLLFFFNSDIYTVQVKCQNWKRTMYTCTHRHRHKVTKAIQPDPPTHTTQIAQTGLSIPFCQHKKVAVLRTPVFPRVKTPLCHPFKKIYHNSHYHILWHGLEPANRTRHVEGSSHLCWCWTRWKLPSDTLSCTIQRPQSIRQFTERER